MSSSRTNLEKFRIPLEEILRATDNFSSKTKIGDGGFGMVHKAQLSQKWENRTVAIKRLNPKGYQGRKEFRNEVEMISSFRHPNIIHFIGFCDEAEEMIIISEYASNGSLDRHLANPDWRRRLTWVNRLNICLGAAKGLDYLHSGVGEYDRVIHRDIKSANILLDENMEAKICDFGLSIYGPRNQEDTQVITKPSGTRFYIDPIYNERGVLRKESDIYSFGIVMFELSSGMLAYPDWRSKDANPQLLMNMVRSYYDDRRVDDELDDGIDKLMDPDISDEIYRSSFITFNGIAHECINIKEIKERPTMDKIIRRVEEALFIQVVKKEPESNPKEHRQTRKGDKVRMASNLALRENYESKKVSVKGKVVLMKKNVVAHNVVVDSHEDEVDELLDPCISIQFISAIHAERTTSEEKALRGKLGKPTILEGRISTTKNWERTYEVIFDWEEEMGLPGAFLVKNVFDTEFCLMTLTLENVPRHGLVHFICNSWVYPAKYYTKDRIFFANKAYLPSETPALLRPYREEELVILRGNGTGMLHEWDRVYDYALYNDLGDPDRGEIGRPVIGGSSEYPYPRRGRTGRPPTKTDPKKESRVWPSWGLKMYVPRDERFGQTYELEAILQFRLPVFGFKALNDEFDSFKDVLKFYDTRVKNPEGPLLDMILDNTSLEMCKEFIRSNGEGLLKCSTPQVIKANKYAWSTDEEFAREMLAGVNPVSIQLLKEFPPSSKLDPQLYGNQNSSIRLDHIQENLDGLDVKEMLKANRLFILDHHDSLMPFIRRINATSTKTYATRTLLLLQKDGALKPIAIELSLPHPYGDNLGAVSKVFTPAREGVDAAIWQLAKTYVAVNDSGIHQLISHWLNTHAVIEPFVIATHRQLSVLHPINKLLHPHFRNTMNINATTRNLFINSGGLLETTLFPGKYSIEMSSKIYNDWVFPNQALPMDLVLRGMAVEDSNSPHGLRLMIEDYPFAVDGLEIWSAIKTWVEDYCKFYYKNDDMVQNDTELQAWWKEVREEGHGDLKHKPWWPKMSSVQDVIDSCTIIIWVSSALHAALNFGQYPYAGYPPNRPTQSRRFLPKPGSPEYYQLERDPDKFILKTMTPQLQSHLSVILMETLSTHTSEEIYLGKRENPNWTMDAEPLEAFKKFGNKLKEIEKKIMNMNQDKRLKNRYGGPVKIPYTLLYPSSKVGLTGRGIPNSVSI